MSRMNEGQRPHNILYLDKPRTLYIYGCFSFSLLKRSTCRLSAIWAWVAIMHTYRVGKNNCNSFWRQFLKTGKRYENKILTAGRKHLPNDIVLFASKNSLQNKIIVIIKKQRLRVSLYLRMCWKWAPLRCKHICTRSRKLAPTLSAVSADTDVLLNIETRLLQTAALVAVDVVFARSPKLKIQRVEVRGPLCFASLRDNSVPKSFWSSWRVSWAMWGGAPSCMNHVSLIWVSVLVLAMSSWSLPKTSR